VFKTKKIPPYRIIDDHAKAFAQQGAKGLRWWFRWLLLTAVTLSILMFAAHRQAYAEGLRSLSYEQLPDDVVAGEVFLREENNAAAQYRPALHLSSDLKADISGMIASVTLTQKFKNTSNEWVEATYVLPLPETAAVDAMQFQVGDRIIRGKIKERREAKKIYKKAKAAGKKAALVVQQRPNLFTQKVANIAPGESLEVRLHFLQKVDYQQGDFVWRLPTTLTPRFIPGRVNTELVSEGNGWAMPTHEVPDADHITPPMVSAAKSRKELKNPISISVKLDAGLPLASVDSAYHKIVLRKEGEHHQIALAAGTTAMDRDFELRWTPSKNNEPAGAIFTEEKDGEHYALVMLVPPQYAALNESKKTLARELIFIIDTSGSMGGGSIVQAKRSLILALERLEPTDRFNVIEFNSTHTRLFPQVMPANAQLVARAINFVGGLRASGGTHMAPALNDALVQFQLSTSGKHLQQLVFITDGSVGNESALFKLIEKQLGRARLFTVGIGSAPNSFFMRKAAQFGRGTYSYISDLNEVSSKMGALFTQLESPVMTQLNLTWPKGRSAETWPARLPDLYANEPLIIAAKLDSSPDSGEVLSLQGFGASAPWIRDLKLSRPKNSPGVASLWARDKIAALMDQKHLGGNPAVIREEVLALALQHKLMSPYTSFVAVEEKISRPKTANLKSNSLPNLVAKGQNLMPVTLPKTASSAPLSLLLSVFFLVLATLCKFTFRSVAIR